MKRIISTLVVASSILVLHARPNIGVQRPAGLNKTAAGCDATKAVIDLDVNNVRAHLMDGGDMWWDRGTDAAAYEVPKGSNKNSLFAGSIWIGGKNAGGTIKVAAQTYRQTGNDYWSGPLDQTGAITFQQCSDWDRFWKVNASDINKFKNITIGKSWFAGDSDYIKTVIPTSSAVAKVIKEWPARGNNDAIGSTGGKLSVPDRDMAPFEDVDSNGLYDWTHGDYPKIVGDQYIWWVFNDKGDAKTETTSDPIGLEIQTAAFAFATNDCLNESTFYNYKVNNFSSETLYNTYMATWCDADLGYAFDDFVGCDTARGLGILYNGDSYDQGATGYGYEIPMVGVDYFQGPSYFNTDSNKVLKLKMSVFTYYNNNQGGKTGNPLAIDDYYEYMTGYWQDGQHFTTACDARAAGPSTNFIFTGDPCGGGWSEASCNNVPDDRRFIHSAGPFPLIPGDKPNNIIIGAVWVPNVGGGKNACFSKIQICDDKAQDLFDNSFKLPFGPQAPNALVQPLDKKLVFDIDNISGSNNENEGYGTNFSKSKYIEVSKKAVNAGFLDSVYKFQGYLVYQLKNENVSVSDIRNKDGSVNTDKAQLVFQCDIKDTISKILNFEPDPAISTEYFAPKLMVTGENKGIKHSFQLTTDAFATGTSKALVNYKYYYYIVVAYAYNNFKKFRQDRTDSTQDKQYLESRTDGKEQPIKVIKAMPHPASDSLYIQTYADYGTGVQIKRIEGKGNDGIPMEMTEESEYEAIQAPNYQVNQPLYKPNLGPLQLKVVNPDSIKAGEYQVWFTVKDSNTSNSYVDQYNDAKASATHWFITKVGTSDTVFSGNDTLFSGRGIEQYNEKYLRKYNKFDWGIEAEATQQSKPGENPRIEQNGLISSSVLFEDPNIPWLSGISDVDGVSFNNWIKAGVEFQGTFANTYGTDYSKCNVIDWDNAAGQTANDPPIIGNHDQLGTFEKVVNGTFSPYNLVSGEGQNVDKCGYGLMWYSGGLRGSNRLEDIYSIDIVFTSDKSKWSRCPVIEMTDNVNGSSNTIADGGANKYCLRKHKGWNGDVDNNDKPIYSDNPADSGMSYFPGYAINIETGERLNICFGEESFNNEDNGKDLIWNPTSVAYKNGDMKWGGKHIIYVSRTKYDEGKVIQGILAQNIFGFSTITREVYRRMMWVGVPLLKPGTSLAKIGKGIIPTDTRVKIRVTRPYSNYVPDASQTLKNGGWPLYTFSTSDIAPAKLGDGRNNYTSNKDELFKRIHVVPNPYYAFSEYEGDRLENKVRIINLPEKAKIQIFTTDGILIKTINKNDTKTNFVDWDIKNEKGIPIASGMYLFHVQLDGIGETVLKWFGAMRPIDITNF